MYEFYYNRYYIFEKHMMVHFKMKLIFVISHPYMQLILICNKNYLNYIPYHVLLYKYCFSYKNILALTTLEYISNIVK